MAGPRNDDPAERRIVAYSGSLPACAAAGVIGEVGSEFAARESRDWNSSLSIASFDRIDEGPLRPWGLDFIPRRFCTAKVTLSDLTRTTVSYSVREKLGFWGLTYDVNWCVQGLDRHKTYAPDCKMARP